MSKRKRGIICAYCGIAWGYDDESPTPELIKEACDHESICEKNPYTAQIRNLKRERDEGREDAAHWKIEYEIVVARLCGKRHQRDNGIVSDDEVIPKLIRALKWIAERYDDSKPMHQVAMDAYQMSCTARAALKKEETK
jgi:hypothetical protein